VSFLGHVISGSGIAVDPSKVDVVSQWETPKCLFGLAVGQPNARLKACPPWK